MFGGIKMWKIFRCKRGEARGFIPGKYLDGGIALPTKEGIRSMINDIKKLEELVGPKIRVLEDKEKIVVQYQREVNIGRPYYKKFLEIYKHEKYRSFDAFRDGDRPEFRTITYECIPTKEVIKVFNILERHPK